MHATRRAALCDAVDRAQRTRGQLSVTALGRAQRSATDSRHDIKKMDRLLSNPHLQAERIALYQGVCRQLLEGLAQPFILVDWSDANATRRDQLLRASVAVQGRSLTLYEAVYPLKQYKCPKTQKAFLAQLSRLLPAGCKPVIVTDAGFQNSWFVDVLALGWDFIGRLSSTVLLRGADAARWKKATTLARQATPCAQALGTHIVAKSRPVTGELYLVKRAKKGRKRKTKQGKSCRSAQAKAHQKAGRRPWLLFSSLRVSADSLISRYALRMQIEETFRDCKSGRFGYGLEASGTRDRKRLEILLLIAMLASLCAWLYGMAAERSGWSRRLQANTVKNRRVLSLIFVGREILRAERTHFTQEELMAALTASRQLILSCGER
jgi:hypothetical protein